MSHLVLEILFLIYSYFLVICSFGFSSIDVRYNALCDIARSRSIISFGLACFHQIPSEEDSHETKHEVQVFNLFVLCDDDYVVESQALQFLVKHGFDFNKQYSSGIPYKRGNQKVICIIINALFFDSN